MKEEYDIPIVTDNYELWKHIFEDGGKVIAFPYNGYDSNWVHTFLYKVTHSKKLGYPLKKLWNKIVFKKWGIKNAKTILFVNPAIWSWQMQPDFMDMLKKKNIKIVLLVLDSMYLMRNEFSQKIIEFSPYFDLVYTFDFKDSQKFGWEHTYAYYSKLKNIQSEEKHYDVICILYNSGRIAQAVQIWDELQHLGLSCFFSISGVTEHEKEQYYRNGIEYNVHYSYPEIIKKVVESSIILEIVQNGQSNCTLRAFEAIAYNKKLLTNCSSITHFPSFNEKYMCYFKDANSIKQINESFFDITEDVSYKCDDEISIKKLLNDIDIKLN